MYIYIYIDIFFPQESFDATTRVTLCMRRMGTKLSSLGGSDTLKNMSSRALQLCKAMVGPSDALEALMVKVGQPETRGEVTKGEVRENLAKVAPIYKDMIELYNEMVALLRKNKSELEKKGINITLKPLAM